MNKEELQQYLQALYQIRKTGARRVTHGGKTVEFHSLTELNTAIANAEAQLDRLSCRRTRAMHLIRRV